MKRILLLLIVFATVFTNAQEINWVTLEEAIEFQKGTPKKIMMDAYTSWCGPCKLLDRNTFRNPDVVKYVNDNYYAVKFNAEGNKSVIYKGKTYTNPNYDASRANKRNTSHELSRHLGISGYPTLVFLDEKGELIAPIVGYKKPSELELYLKMFKTDEHKNLDTQEKFNIYYKAFKSEFKG